MWKAIISDLDHTLLREDRSLSDHTVRVLEKAKNHGLKILAATARPERAILRYQEQAGFDALTTLNGARTLVGEQVLERRLPKETADLLLEALCRLDGAVISLETSTGFYANHPIPEWEPIVLTDFPRLPEETHIYKILVSGPLEEIRSVLDAELPPDLYYTLAQGDLFQIMSTEIRKWNGIVDMLGAFGLCPEEAIYFGDDHDDVEAIRKCGRGIAVANAIPEVLEAADEVIGPNQEDAVAEYVERHLKEM